MTVDQQIAQAVRYLLEQQELVRAPRREALPTPIASGGSMATVFVAAADASELSKRKADFICTGTDDQVTMRRAAAAGNYFGTLWLSEGNFSCNMDGIPVEMYGTIRGLGRQATYLDVNASGVANEYFFKLDGSSTLQDLAMNVDGLIASGAAVYIDGTEDGIDNCHIDAGSGGSAIKGNGNYGWVRNSYLYGDVAAVKLVSGFDYRISACIVEGNTNAVEASGFGGPLLISGSIIEADDAVVSGGDDDQIVNNIIYSYVGPHLTLAGLRNLVMGNLLTGFTSRGIEASTCFDLAVLNNFIMNTNGAAIHLTSCTRPRVEGNVLFNVNINPFDPAALVVDGTGVSAPLLPRGFIVSDNMIDATNSNGINISGGYSHGKVDGNKVTRVREHGISIADLTASTVDNNLISWTDNLSGNDLWDGIILTGNSDRNRITGNRIIAEVLAGGPGSRYGINISASTCDCNVMVNNHATGPFQSAYYNDAGTSTQKFYPSDAAYGDNFADCGEEDPGVVEGGEDDVTAPAVPAGFAATPGDTEIFLNWADNGEQDLASYKIYRATASGGPYTLLMTVTDLSEAADTGLTNGTQLWYKISAIDESGNESAQSSAVTTTPTVPPAGVPPPVPAGLAADPEDGHVDLAWGSVFASDFSHYNVYTATVSGGPYTLFGTRTVANASVTGLTNGTPYFFVVTSEDLAGNESANSTQVTATPTAVTPPAGLPAPDVIFNSTNLYTPAKVTAEPAGTVFQFTITGGTGSGPRYENAAIPVEAGNKYRFDLGTVLDGNGTTVLAFTGTAADVEIYDCEWTAYQGQNASGVNNTKGAAAIRLRAGWKMYRPNGHHNKYSAVSFDGSNSFIEGGRLHYNGEFGYKGGGQTTGCYIDGTEVDHNGGGTGLDLRGDQGGCKIVHSNGFITRNCHVHHNLGSSTQGGNGVWYDINNVNAEIHDNDIHDNTGGGIFYEVSLGGEIYNNTLTNNGRDYAVQAPGSMWPVSAQIQISNSGGNGLHVHDNTIVVDGTASGRGFHGITMFNSDHFQWTNGVISNGCLGTRNVLVENNTITMSGAFWKSAMAITGNLPTSRSGDQFCNQQPITATASNNRIRTNTESLSGGAFASTPYIRAGTRVSASAWAGFGYS